ncbi:hypothetical protein HELRODRAFT_171017 [Helobdella robusta]|uniref:Tetraspanin n=1 Tax=Helobdella robusta TaxID=6412 RepID=T1F3P8_HELRO|nr:hypothetical protein HELRODRAFT_171017 [Helobdella robusta]ESO06981.1 hypothetical protein HELRODRAFT_171017 [Helobdella robusta]
MFHPTISEGARVALSKLLIGVNALCFVVGFMFCRIGLKIRPIITDFMKLFQNNFFDQLSILMLVCGCTLIVGSVVCVYFYLCAIVVNQAGMIEAMKLYKSNPEYKQAIDRVQIEYSCCGSDKYSDWFQVAWISDEFVDAELTEVKEHLKTGVYLADDAPFSCCDPMSPRPCINRHVHDNDVHPSYDFLNDITLYKTGCKLALEVFIEVKCFYPLIVAFTSFLIFYQLNFVLASFLDTSITLAIRSGDPRVTTIGFCCTCCSNITHFSTAVAACPTPSSVKADSCNPFYRPSQFAIEQSGTFDVMNRGRNAGSSQLWVVVENESSSGFSNVDAESLKAIDRPNVKYDANKNAGNSRYALNALCSGEKDELEASLSKTSEDICSGGSKFSARFIKSNLSAIVKKVSDLSVKLKQRYLGTDGDASEECRHLMANNSSEDEDNENLNHYANQSDSDNTFDETAQNSSTTSSKSLNKNNSSLKNKNPSTRNNNNSKGTANKTHTSAETSSVSQTRSELVGRKKILTQLLLDANTDPMFPSDADSNEVKSMPKLQGMY